MTDADKKVLNVENAVSIVRILATMMFLSRLENV